MCNPASVCLIVMLHSTVHTFFRLLMEITSNYFNHFRFSAKSVVYKTDFFGQLLESFGHVGRALGEFNEPSGITREGNDVLLIADSRNDRIQVCRLLLS